MMKVVFPIQEFRGGESELYGHFGSAPCFAVMNTKDGHLELLDNHNCEHVHGDCNPLTALDNRLVDAIVVLGIGPSAWNKLRREGIRIFKSSAGTIRQAAENLKNGALKEIQLDDVCGLHGMHDGCGHRDFRG